MNRRLTLLLSYILLISFVNAKPKKLVCVVGAGVSGLNALKHLAEHPHDFKPIAFEVDSNVGGLWIYSDNPNTDPIRPMYKHLRTQVAKEIMACPDYRDFNGENRSTPSYKAVDEYLRNYTEHFNLRQYIHFNTRVQKISALAGKKSHAKWLVQVQNLKSRKTKKIICDATIISTGIYNKPSIPTIPGIEKFRGRVIHSSNYRVPEEFANQTVLILGAGISGLDLTVDLSAHAQTIYLSQRHEKLPLQLKNVKQVAGVVAFNSSGLILQDGSIIKSVDTLIYCTGYKTELPFLDQSTGVKIVNKNAYPLYKSIINVEHPTMGFVGYNTSIRAFCPLYYTQANYFISSLQGKFKLPHHDDMLKSADEAIKRKFIEVHDLTRLNDFAEEAHFKPIPDFFIKANNIWAELRRKDRFNYKDYDLVVRPDGTITTVKVKKPNY